MNYTAMTPAELWSHALKGSNSDRELYLILSELVLKYSSQPNGSFFPPKSCPLLLDLLDRPHEPQLKIIVCTLIGYLCNVTSTAKEDLANRGVISLLLKVILSEMNIKNGKPSEMRLTRLLFEHVSSMLQFFSLGPEFCLRKMTVTDVIGIISQMLDKDNPNFFWFDSSETLESLVTDRLLVAEQFPMTSTAASTVFYQQFGYDFRTSFRISDSYVLDLYDTNGEDDVHIAEELNKRSRIMMYQSRNEECEIEDISETGCTDAKVTYCINGAYFWAVLGHENIDVLIEFESFLCDKNRFPQLDKNPTLGQMVGAVRKSDAVYRGQVLSVDANLVTVFAVDYGSVETLPVADLRGISQESKFQRPGLAHLCKLMGVRRSPVWPEVSQNLLMTLCNLTSDLSSGMGDVILSSKLLDSLKHLLTYPNIGLSAIVVQVLSNLSHHDQVKSELVRIGLTDSVIGVMKRNMIGLSKPGNPNPESDQLIESCVVFLWNVMFKNPANKNIIDDQGGIHLITELTGVDKPESVRQTALKTLRVFVGRVAVTSHVRPRRLREDLLASSWDSSGNSDSETSASDPNLRGNKLMSLSSGSSPERGQGDDSTRSKSLPHSVVDKVDQYILKEKTFLRNSLSCELMSLNFNAVGEKQIAQLICGFLNIPNEGGSIFFGVRRNGEVVGEIVSHSKRDHLRLCIDKLTIKKLNPPTVPGIVLTLFHPVLDVENGKHLDDLFVVEIRVKPSLSPTLFGVKYNSEPRPFVRSGPSNTVEMTGKDVFVWSVEMNEISELKELKKLRHEVERLRVIRAQMKKRSLSAGSTHPGQLQPPPKEELAAVP